VSLLDGLGREDAGWGGSGGFWFPDSCCISYSAGPYEFVGPFFRHVIVHTRLIYGIELPLRSTRSLDHFCKRDPTNSPKDIGHLWDVVERGRKEVTMGI
jgi:hypothetical protein